MTGHFRWLSGTVLNVKYFSPARASGISIYSAVRSWVLLATIHNYWTIRNCGLMSPALKSLPQLQTIE